MEDLPLSSTFISVTRNFIPTNELRWLPSVFSGIIMCNVVYKLTGNISHLCFGGYSKLSDAKKIEWNNRGFSTFHAVIVAAASVYLLLFSNLFDENSQDELIVKRSSTLSNSILGISIGYFVSDLAMILWHFPALGGVEYGRLSLLCGIVGNIYGVIIPVLEHFAKESLMTVKSSCWLKVSLWDLLTVFSLLLISVFCKVLHHLLSLLSVCLSLISGEAQLYILMILFSESTTPFVNLRWYLDVAGLKNSKAYVVNGFLLFLGWLVARIVLFIFFFFTHMIIHFDEVKEVFPVGFYALLSVPPILAVMNVIWFWKIVKGLIKTLSKPKKT